MNKKHTRRSAIKLGGAAALGIAAFPSILSAQTGSLSDIKKRGYLLYGFNGEKPYNYMDAEGNLTGSEIDLARVIAKNIGIDEVQGVAMNFDSFIPAIMAGRIDTCLPIFVKPPRCEKIQYCRSHLIEGQSVQMQILNKITSLFVCPKIKYKQYSQINYFFYLFFASLPCY